MYYDNLYNNVITTFIDKQNIMKKNYLIQTSQIFLFISFLGQNLNVYFFNFNISIFMPTSILPYELGIKF